MDFEGWLNMLSLWAVFVPVLAICPGSVGGGAVLAGITLRRRTDQEPDGSLRTMVAALPGLLVFVLAFTCGIAVSQVAVRLRGHADTRLIITPESVVERLKKLEQFHGQRWSQRKSLSNEDMDSKPRSVFVTSLDEPLLSRHAMFEPYFPSPLPSLHLWARNHER